MLLKIRTEGEKKSFHSLSQSLKPQSMCPRGPSRSWAPEQGCPRCLFSKKALWCLCSAFRSGIHGHGIGGKDARCHILLMSQVLLQLPTDFAYVFLELTVISESLGDPMVLRLQIWVCCETAARCAGGCVGCVSPWPAHPGAIHAGRAESPASPGLATARPSHSYQSEPLSYSSLQCFLELIRMYWSQIKVLIVEKANYFLK